MCLVRRGIIVELFFFPFLFFLFFFAYKGWTHCCRKRRRATEAEIPQTVVCRYPVIITVLCFLGISLEMDGLVGMERQKFPFTIENILSKYPNNSGDKGSCGTTGFGFKEKTESGHHACLCCCYCSHCADMFHTDFIHEGRTNPAVPFPKNDTVS